MTLAATVALLSALNAEMRVEANRVQAGSASLDGEVRVESIRAKLEVVPELTASVE